MFEITGALPYHLVLILMMMVIISIKILIKEVQPSDRYNLQLLYVKLNHTTNSVLIFAIITTSNEKC